MSGHSNPEPWPPPLRAVLTSTLTQSPDQELDGSQPWSKWSAGAADGGTSVRQETRALPSNSARLDGPESRTGSGVAVAQANANLKSFARNSQFEPGSNEPPDLVDSSREPAKIPLFPPRPRYSQASKSETKTGAGVREPPPPSDLTKPYMLQPPQDAPKVNSTAYAGFSSWSRAGKHAEDVLNEQTITSGHYDKVQISPNETISARPVIWSSVKHKSGLQVLSTLFTGALKRRQLCGTLSSKCTFKPPPRVTLTDTKREAWLKDLADPVVPLRRLSRTIPHGIRGKALLDQCLSKKVPIWRAIWLVKCVGANEIRAFKRKGASGAFVVGGENKWITDWTIQVEHFIDNLIQACGVSDWRERTTYGLDLMLQIYCEHLIQKESFLVWICNGIQEASVDTLPIWLLLAKAYIQEISAHRKTGRHLASALCSQHKSVREHGPVESLLGLENELTSFIQAILSSCPSCFIQPDIWEDVTDALEACTSSNKNSAKNAYEQLLERTRCFLHREAEQRLTTDLRILPQLVECLDSLPSSFKFKGLLAQCINISNEIEDGVFTILSWATTRYRSGLGRLYLAVRLLRQWSRKDLDLHRPVFELLERASTSSGFLPNHVFKLVAELIRSRHFTVSRYLQWLMARGTRTSAASETPNFFLRLLDHVPAHDQPEHIHNLRKILFGPCKVREPNLSNAKILLTAQLSFVSRSQTNEAGPSIDWTTSSLDGLLPCEMYALAHWLRQELVRHVSNDNDDDDNDDEKMDFDDTPALLSTIDFDVVFGVLDNCNDHSILADVLGIFIDFGPKALLTHITSLVNLYFDVFHAIGAADDLFSRLVQHLTETLSSGTSNKALMTALFDLAAALPGRKTLQKRIEKELISIEFSCITAAGSPVADYVADPTTHSNSDFLNEVDSLLRSGSSMDGPLLSRIFEDITAKLQRLWLKKDELLGSFFKILSRLRFFDHEAFDSLLGTWLESIVPSSKRPRLRDIIPLLVCTGSITLVNFMDRIVAFTNVSASTSNMAQELLGLLVFDSQSLESEQTWQLYRFSCQRRELVKERTDLTSALLLIIMKAELRGEGGGSPLSTLANQTLFPELFQQILSSPETDLNSFRKLFGVSNAHQSLLPPLEQTLGEHVPMSIPRSWQDKIESILQASNEFNVAFYQLKLVSIVGNIPGGRISGEQLDEFASCLLSNKLLANGVSFGVWRQLMSHLPLEILLKIQKTSLAKFFAALPPSCEPGAVVGRQATDIGSVDRFLSATGLVQRLVPHESRFPLLISVTEQLQEILTRLSDCWASTASDLNRETRLLHPIKESHGQLRNWMLALLQLLTMHYDILSHPKLLQSTLARLAILLSLLLVQTCINLDTSLSVRTADFLAVLSDHLSRETRQQCLYTLREQFSVRDARVEFLLGSSGLGDGPSLALMTNDKTISKDGRSPGIPGLDRRLSTSFPYTLRPWEMLSNATPVMGENDTSISLTLFGAKKAVL